MAVLSRWIATTVVAAALVPGVGRGLGGFGPGFHFGQHFGAGLGGCFQAV